MSRWLVGLALVGLGSGLAAAWYAEQIARVARKAEQLRVALEKQWARADDNRTELLARLAALETILHSKRAP